MMDSEVVFMFSQDRLEFGPELAAQHSRKGIDVGPESDMWRDGDAHLLSGCIDTRICVAFCRMSTSKVVFNFAVL